MAAANFSRDVLEMFYGPIEENQKLRAPIRPSIIGGFKVLRTGQGLKNNVPSFSIQLIFGHIYEQSQNLEPICALVLE